MLIWSLVYVKPWLVIYILTSIFSIFKFYLPVFVDLAGFEINSHLFAQGKYQTGRTNKFLVWVLTGEYNYSTSYVLKSTGIQ